MSRAAVNLLLQEDGGLIALGLPPGATHAANSLDTPQDRPFIVMRWEEKTRAFERRGPQGLTVWVHDEPGDYTRINAMLERIKTVLENALHVGGPDGWTITQINWRGDSPDLYDDGWGTITRNAGFVVVSRPS